VKSRFSSRRVSLSISTSQMCNRGKGEIGRIVERGLLQPRLDLRSIELVPDVSRERDLANIIVLLL